MKRFGVTIAAMLCATAVSAQDWNVVMNVSGDVDGVLDAAGTRSSLMADSNGNFMSADAFSDGVAAGQTTCANADFFEIDYFFGHETSLGGHLLFYMERGANGFVAVEPSMFMDTLDNNMEVVETYASFGDVAVALDRVECAVDGTFSVAVTYKGRLTSGMGAGPEFVMVNGTADAEFTLRDMSEY